MSFSLNNNRIVKAGVLFGWMAAICVMPTVKAQEKNESAPSQAPASKEGPQIEYQLVNVTIPRDSPLRERKDIDQPPDIYVIVKENGKALGETAAVTGWEVDFPLKDAIRFPIRIRSEARYSLEVWDYDRWSRDQNIFNITQIKGEEFAHRICQKGTRFSDPTTLAYLLWKKVPNPEKQLEKAKVEEKTEEKAKEKNVE